MQDPKPTEKYDPDQQKSFRIHNSVFNPTVMSGVPGKRS
jgi:hypothetical protein